MPGKRPRAGRALKRAGNGRFRFLDRIATREPESIPRPAAATDRRLPSGSGGIWWHMHKGPVMIRTIVLLACAASLAGCDREPAVDARNASVEEVAEQVRDAAGGSELFVRPGKWRSEVTIEEVSMPGLPPEMAERMKAMVAQNQTRSFESCLTEEEARRPKEEFFAGKSNACRYDHFTMDGGKIDAKMRCEQQGVTQVMQMAGTYAPDSYRMRMSTSTEGGPAGSALTMRMRVDSKRVGQCGETAA